MCSFHPQKKSSLHRNSFFLHPILKENVPFFSSLHIDHLDPLEKVERGLKHIFLIVDGFTKFIRLYPCKLTKKYSNI